MAKKINDKNEFGKPPPANDPPAWRFNRDDDPLLQSLDDRNEAALLLSSELAAWFGDHSFQVPRV